MLHGCQDSSSNAGEEERITSGTNGGRLLTISQRRAPQFWTVATEPLLVLGGFGAIDADQQFSQVWDARMFGDSLVAVPDWGVLQVGLFDRSGAMPARFGSRGDGPGEFQLFTDIRQCDRQNRYVLDLSTSVMKVFGLDGRFLREFRVYGTNPNQPPQEWDCSEGRFLMMGWGAAGPDEIGPFRRLVPLAISGEPRGSTKTIGWVAGPERHGTSGSTGPRPLGAMTRVRIRGDRVFVTEASDYRVHHLDTDGEVVWVLERHVDSIPVDRQAYVASLTPENLSGNDLRQFNARWRDHEFPAFLPAIRDMLVDREGNLWVESYPPVGADEVEWSVYNQDGVWLADVILPAALKVTDVARTT
jgi:hypothetical protein